MGGCIRNMMEVKKIIKNCRDVKHKVYNDKLYRGGQSDNNPYTAFLRMQKLVRRLILWKKIDIWVINLQVVKR